MKKFNSIIVTENNGSRMQTGNSILFSSIIQLGDTYDSFVYTDPV